MNAEIHQMFLPAYPEDSDLSESEKISMVVSVLEDLGCYYKIKVPGRLRTLKNCGDEDFDRVEVDLGAYVKPYLDQLLKESIVTVPAIDGIAQRFLQVAINQRYKEDDRFSGHRVKTMSGDDFVVCILTKEEK